MFHAGCLPLLLLYFSAFKPTKGISMPGCSNPDRLEGNTYHFNCYLGNSNSTSSWSLISPTRQVTDIGSCVGDRNCSSPVFSDFRLQRWGTRNELRMQDIKKQSTGILVCSEHHSNGSVETVNCTLNVRSVYMTCGSRGYELLENNSYYSAARCDASYSTRPITWSLVTPSGLTKTLGSCQGDNTCSSPYSPYITIRRSSSRYNYMRIDYIKRETAGVLICSDGIDTHNCTLDVYNPAMINCKLQLHRTNWTALITCDVTMTYSARGRFEYRVRQWWNHAQSGCSRNDYSDYVPYMPSPYFNITTGKGFYRGSYTASFALPMRDMGEGTYSYSTYTYPGNTYQANVGSFVVERPSPPSVQCEGALRDAGRVPCVCSTSSMGSPAGRLIWFSGDTVLAAGQYGVTSLLFPSNVTVDGCDVMQITCQLDWILNQNMSFPLACVARNTADTDEQNTSSTDRVWGITASAVLGVFVVVVLVLVIVLLRRGQCSRGGGDPDAGTVHFSQHQPQAEDPAHTYTGLNIQHVAGRGKKVKGSAKTRTTSLGDPEHVYENTDVTDNP